LEPYLGLGLRNTVAKVSLYSQAGVTIRTVILVRDKRPV